MQPPGGQLVCSLCTNTGLNLNRTIRHHQRTVTKQELQTDLATKTGHRSTVLLYLCGHGLFKADFSLHPNTPWGLEHRPDLLLNHMVLFKDINREGVAHFQKPEDGVVKAHTVLHVPW